MNPTGRSGVLFGIRSYNPNFLPLARNHTIPPSSRTYEPLSLFTRTSNILLSIAAAGVLVTLLELAGFVGSATHINMRQFEFFDNSPIQNLDELEMGPEKAFALVDDLCSQAPQRALIR
jgi:hypothetical protein